MAATQNPNRAYFTINGQKYPLFGLVTDLTWDTGVVSKPFPSMTPDGNNQVIIRSNFSPTIQWTELLPLATQYQKLLSLLWSTGADIVVQSYIIGTQAPAGQAYLFSGCVFASQGTNFSAQDIASNRRIMLNALTVTEA